MLRSKGSPIQLCLSTASAEYAVFKGVRIGSQPCKSPHPPCDPSLFVTIRRKCLEEKGWFPIIWVERISSSADRRVIRTLPSVFKCLFNQFATLYRDVKVKKETTLCTMQLQSAVKIAGSRSLFCADRTCFNDTLLSLSHVLLTKAGRHIFHAVALDQIPRFDI